MKTAFNFREMILNFGDYDSSLVDSDLEPYGCFCHSLASTRLSDFRPVFSRFEFPQERSTVVAAIKKRTDFDYCISKRYVM